jgi:uncharacterized protein (TIGR04222 family)
LRVPTAEGDLPVLNLSAFELAYLNGGKILTLNAAIANLVRQKILFLDAKQKRLLPGNQKPGELSELERVICTAVARPGGEKIGEVRIAAKTIVGEISEQLKALGVVVDDMQARKAIRLPLLIAFTPIALGGIKLFVGINRGKPVGFLVVLMIISLVISLIALARRPLRSRLGDAVLKQLQSEQGSLKHSLGDRSMDPMLFATGVGLFGMAALDNTP